MTPKYSGEFPSVMRDQGDHDRRTFGACPQQMLTTNVDAKYLLADSYRRTFSVCSDECANRGRCYRAKTWLGGGGLAEGKDPGTDPERTGALVGSSVGTGSTTPSEAAGIGRAEPRGRALSPTPPSTPKSSSHVLARRISALGGKAA